MYSTCIYQVLSMLCYALPITPSASRIKFPAKPNVKHIHRRSQTESSGIKKNRRKISLDIGRSASIFIPSAIPGWTEWMSGKAMIAELRRKTYSILTYWSKVSRKGYLSCVVQQTKTNGVWTNRKALTLWLRNIPGWPQFERRRHKCEQIIKKQKNDKPLNLSHRMPYIHQGSGARTVTRPRLVGWYLQRMGLIVAWV